MPNLDTLDTIEETSVDNDTTVCHCMYCSETVDECTCAGE